MTSSRRTPPPTNEHGEELITQLRMLRERAGLTQEQAGARLGGSRFQVNRIENGRIPAHSELLAMLELYEASGEEIVTYLGMWDLAWQPDGRRIRGKQLRRPIDS
jgi:transcriptional regulator with XRE-family HTH domain